MERVAASLLRWCGDAKAARLFWEQRPHPTPEALAERLGIDPADRPARLTHARLRAAEAVQRAAAGRIEVTTAGDPGYPGLLSRIVDPPIALWARGDSAVLDRPAVAVVGSRRPSPAGRAIAGRLGQDLARAGLVVVSGLARGIDAAAHEGALRGGGCTVGVLGSGVDVVYPPEHADLAARLLRTGCLVSELPPGTEPLPHHFPLRNRLISGLSLAVVVVEAADKSGSLITARMALEQGRSVCAVPGNVVSGCYQGCHALIKDGARLVETVEDVLEELRWVSSGSGTCQPDKSHFINGLLAVMRAGVPVSVDHLADTTGRTGLDVLTELGRLEVAGQVERTAGGLFVRLD